MDQLAQLNQQGCSQRQMAAALRVSRQTVCRWLDLLERAKDLPPEDPPTETTATYIDDNDIYSLWLRAMKTVGDRNVHA